MKQEKGSDSKRKISDQDDVETRSKVVRDHLWRVVVYD